MDFHQLLAKMQELDSPTTTESITQECGDPMGMNSPVMPQMPSQPPVPPPSLSVNLNAHGLDDIESIMKLIAKVNPDSVPQEPAMPKLGMEPSIMSINPSNSFDGTGPLKMLPDFDADNDNKVGGEMDIDGDNGITIPIDIDADHDMDNKDAEDEDEGYDPERMKDGDMMGSGGGDINKDDEDEQEEAWANEPDIEVKSIDYMNNQLAGGMNRPKGTYPKVAGGDNPMQKVKEETDSLRMQIRAELQKRLAEAKGAK